MKRSAFFSIIIALLLNIMVMPMPLTAAEQAPSANQAEESTDSDPSNAAISLEKAIIIAKEKVPIPEGLDQFSSDYQEADGKGRWNLRWRSIDGDVEFTVSVDPESEELTNINYYKNIYHGGQYKGLPEYTKEECIEIAKQEGLRILPDKFPKTKLESQNQFFQDQLLRARDYPIVYNFNFRKMVSGIPVVDQGIDIGINAENGELVRFNCTWDDEQVLPKSSTMLNQDEAVSIFKDKSGYELTYYMTPNENPDIPGDIKLVYRFKQPGRFAINALSGEIFNEDIYFRSEDRLAGGGDGKMAMSEQNSLTPEEIKAIEETKTVISADKAQAIAAEIMDISGSYGVTHRSLERDYNVPGSRLWHIQFTGQESNDTISVAINAGSGELVSFYKGNEREFYNQKDTRLKSEEAQKIAFDLIKKLQPVKSGQVVLRQSDPVMIFEQAVGKYLSRSFNFNYARKINEVVYPENGFNVSVSAYNGEVVSYRIIWQDAKLPNADSVIDATEINNKYLEEYPLKLEYSKGYSPYRQGSQQEYFLIYRSSSDGEIVMYDALSGQQIDYQGRPFVKNKQPFSDISGHAAEADITLLTKEDIVKGDGGKFRPDDKATVAEALAMLDKAFGNRYYYPLVKQNEPWYKQVLESAKAKGILEEDYVINPEAPLERLQLIRLGINAQGWGKLVRVSEIFKLEVADAASIDMGNKGYASAAVGLNLLPLKDGLFNPNGQVTRAEVATFLVHLLKL